MIENSLALVSPLSEIRVPIPKPISSSALASTSAVGRQITTIAPNPPPAHVSTSVPIAKPVDKLRLPPASIVSAQV